MLQSPGAVPAKTLLLLSDTDHSPRRAWAAAAVHAHPARPSRTGGGPGRRRGPAPPVLSPPDGKCPFSRPSVFPRPHLEAKEPETQGRHARPPGARSCHSHEGNQTRAGSSAGPSHSWETNKRPELKRERMWWQRGLQGPAL